MTEIVGYDGPIIMTEPTRAIVPYMLEDFRKIAIDTKELKDLAKDSKENKETKEESKSVFYTSEHIANCIKKVASIFFSY
jgi:integrator complex subunit 11